jgi:hypothetical protein
MKSILVRDDELRGRAGVDFRRLFHDLLHFGETRSALKRGTKFVQLLGGPAGEGFHPAVVKIAHESAEVQFLGDALRKVAKTHSLHGAGDEITPGLFGIAHGTRNCNREVQASGVVEARRCARSGKGSALDWRGDGAEALAHPNLMAWRLFKTKFWRGGGVLFRAAVAFGFSGVMTCALFAQQPPQGPMDPPPEHHATRISNVADPGEPPNLPIEQVIKKLSQEEDTYFLARGKYTYRKTIRIQELGPDGKPAGEYLLVTQAGHDSDGTTVDKVVERPRSTLTHMQLESEDLDGLNRIPSFPLTTSQLGKYDLKYLGKDQVDEISCYIFQVKPKVVERVHAYFQGVVWIDDKYLEVVKTYGSWVNDLGDVKSSPQVPFTTFETYREFIDGKFWFPTYSRSDETLHLKGEDIPLRMVIKWSDFKLAGTGDAAPAGGNPAKTNPPGAAPAASSPGSTPPSSAPPSGPPPAGASSTNLPH